MTPIPDTSSSAPVPDHDRIDLAGLAEVLTQRGYQTSLITPRPYLTVQRPGSHNARLVYAVSSHFYLAPAEQVGGRDDITLAADTIGWILGSDPEGMPQ